VALTRQGRVEPAVAHYAEALRLKPSDPRMHFNLGALLQQEGRIDEALSHYAEALRLRPDDPQIYNNRALIWAAAPNSKHRDGPKAVESATHACKLTGWRDPGLLDTCAAAYAETGDFESAVKWQTHAIDLLTDVIRIEDFRSRLKLYQAREPYRLATGSR
jgi:tetratricopeptide (TPR) repeat protein